MGLFLLLGPQLSFFGFGKCSNTVLGSFDIAEQLLFSMLYSILILNFDLNFGYFLELGGPQWTNFGLE